MLPFSCGRHGNYCHPPCWSGLSHRLPAAPQPALSTAPGPHAEPCWAVGWDLGPRSWVGTRHLGGGGWGRGHHPKGCGAGSELCRQRALLCVTSEQSYPTTGMGFLHQTTSCSPHVWLKFTFTSQVMSSTDSISPLNWEGKDDPTNTAVPVSHRTRAGLGAQCWWLLIALLL